MRRPAGITVLAVLAFLNVLTYVALIVLSIRNPDGLRALLESISPGAGTQLMQLGAFVPVYFLAMAIVAGLVGRGLLELKNWARITMMVIVILSLVATLVELAMKPSGSPPFLIIVRLGIAGLVIWYLSTKNIRGVFGKKPLE